MPSRLEPVPTDEVRSVWPHVVAPLERLLKELDEYRSQDVLDALLAAEMQLWWSADSFVITQVQKYPCKRALAILWAGGDLEVISSHLEDLKAWGRDRHCHFIRMHGREGWQRVFDLERQGVVLRSDL